MRPVMRVRHAFAVFVLPFALVACSTAGGAGAGAGDGDPIDPPADLDPNPDLDDADLDTGDNAEPEPPPPGALRAPTGIELPPTALGAAADVTVRLGNGGAGPLVVRDIFVAGGTAGELTLTPPALPFVLAPGAEVTVTLRYAPADARFPDGGTLVVYSDDPAGRVVRIPISGVIAGEAAAAVDPEALNFGPVSSGDDVVLAVRVKNTGAEPSTRVVRIDALRIEGDDAPRFALPPFAPAGVPGGPGAFLPLLPFAVPAGAYLEVPVRLRPARRGPFVAALVVGVSVDGAPRELRVPLSGRRTGPAIDAPDTLDLGVVRPGAVKTGTLLVRNIGDADLRLTGIELVGDAAWSIDAPTAADLPLVVRPGNDRAVALRIDAAGFDARFLPATLTLRSNDPDRPALLVGLRAAVSLDPCDLGYANCDGDTGGSCETNTRVSLDHCGGCNRPCRAEGARTACRDGRCTVEACAPGRADCNRDAADGCEADIETDVNRCGGCDGICRAAGVTVARCTAGSCGVVTCADGAADCDGIFENGCEIDTRANVNACGTCTNRCPFPDRASARSCTAGRCGFTCRFGFTPHPNDPVCESESDKACRTLGANAAYTIAAPGRYPQVRTDCPATNLFSPSACAGRAAPGYESLRFLRLPQGRYSIVLSVGDAFQQSVLYTVGEPCGAGVCGAVSDATTRTLTVDCPAAGCNTTLVIDDERSASCPLGEIVVTRL